MGKLGGGGAGHFFQARCIIHHIFREANDVVDGLAKEGVFHDFILLMFNDVCLSCFRCLAVFLF